MKVRKVVQIQIWKINCWSTKRNQKRTFEMLSWIESLQDTFFKLCARAAWGYNWRIHHGVFLNWSELKLKKSLWGTKKLENYRLKPRLGRKNDNVIFLMCAWANWSFFWVKLCNIARLYAIFSIYTFRLCLNYCGGPLRRSFLSTLCALAKIENVIFMPYW